MRDTARSIFLFRPRSGSTGRQAGLAPRAGRAPPLRAGGRARRAYPSILDSMIIAMPVCEIVQRTFASPFEEISWSSSTISAAIVVTTIDGEFANSVVEIISVAHRTSVSIASEGCSRRTSPLPESGPTITVNLTQIVGIDDGKDHDDFSVPIPVIEGRRSSRSRFVPPTTCRRSSSTCAVGEDHPVTPDEISPWKATAPSRRSSAPGCRLGSRRP